MIFKALAAMVLLILLALAAYAGFGYFDALRDSDGLKQRAAGLMASQRGPDDLTQRKLHQLLAVEDPAFWRHNGFDVETKGAGLTTITQSLAKRLAFEDFEPGIGKIRQTTYALGLEQRLSKKEILALALETVQMGPGPDGWMEGMFDASMQIYGKPPAALSDHQWLKLVAVLIAPRQFNLQAPDKPLEDRVARIERLLAGRCAAQDERDVWLDRCGPAAAH